MGFDLQAHHLRVAVNPASPSLVWYNHLLATQPSRCDRLVEDHWWIVSRPYNRPWGSNQSLLFVRSIAGDIPHCTNDTENIYLMKRILFPWAEVLFLPQVFLVRDKKAGWKVPGGEIR